MSERMFPIQSERGAKPHPTSIPWSIAELAYSVYSSKYGRSQSLERLAERHGFGPSEMDEFVPDWRERCDENKQLRDEVARLRECELDAKRYRRLQVLGCAPSTSKQLENGTVLCFTNLDEFVDVDLKAVPSRGEAALTPQAGKGGGNG